MNQIYKSIILAISAMMIPLAQADTLQSLDSIEQTAYEFAVTEAQMNYDNPRIEVGALDSRLRLAQCATKLMAFNQTAGVTKGNQTVGVKCTHPTPWTVYVPVKVKVMLPVLVSRKALAAKHIITDADVTMQIRDIALFHRGYIEQKSQVIGQQLSYAIPAGTVLNSSIITAKKVIRRGEQISLVVASRSLEIRMKGTALSDAKLGQKIKVKNDSSKRIIEGTVAGPGLVKVTM